jgi:hypothetical protein
VVVGSFFRNPLALFATVLVVGVALIVGGMKAFGGASSAPTSAANPLSPGQFARANEHICLSLRQELKSLVASGKPKSLRQAITYIRRGTTIFDHLRTEYYNLIPPPSDRGQFRRLLTRLNVMDVAMHRLDHLAETHQWARFVFLARSRWFKKVFRHSGPPTKLKNMCRPVGQTLA